MQNSFTIYTTKHLLVGGFFRFAGVIIFSVPFQNYIYTFCVTLFNACFCILYKFVWSNAFPHSYSNIGAILLGVSRWHWYTLSQFGKKSTWNLGNNAIRKIVSDPLTEERKGIVIILIFPLMLCISVQVLNPPPHLGSKNLRAKLLMHTHMLLSPASSTELQIMWLFSLGIWQRNLQYTCKVWHISSIVA